LCCSSEPCPCGKLGDPAAPCTCLPDAVVRYNARLSGPFLDRIDLRVHVPRVPYEELRDAAPRERSSEVRRRVVAARERMARRGRRANAELSVVELRRHCPLDAAAERLVAGAVKERRLSARGYHRLLRVARTVADLAGSESVGREHLASALLLRA